MSHYDFIVIGAGVIGASVAYFLSRRGVAVTVVERAGVVVLVAKWVRPDKVDGSYLPENSGREALYHRGPR